MAGKNITQMRHGWQWGNDITFTFLNALPEYWIPRSSPEQSSAFSRILAQSSRLHTFDNYAHSDIRKHQLHIHTPCRRYREILPSGEVVSWAQE